jgi:hypothetical protein
MVLLLYAGYKLPTERYITPDRGFGYALGILGGSAMLVLLLYPARKRVRWLAFIGTVRRWFQAHMILGVVGPVCVLYHANFSLGAPNSNVALFCTLVVAGSGLFGRYFYSKIHHGLYGHRTTLAELGASASRLRAAPLSIAFLPELIERLEREEQQIISIRASISSALVVPFIAHWRISLSRARLRRYTRHALAAPALDSRVLAEQRRRLRRTAFSYIDTRLQANGKVVTFQAFERLFSYWHLLHLPLFYILVVAAIAHVIAVHLY